MTESEEDRNITRTDGKGGKQEGEEMDSMKGLHELRIPGIKLRRMQEGVDGTEWRNQPEEKEEKEPA